MTELILYTRRGCCLCEEMLEALLPRVRGRARVREVDVDDDPALAQRYGLKVPVLAAGDTELCHFLLDVEALQRHLDVVAPAGDPR